MNTLFFRGAAVAATVLLSAASLHAQSSKLYGVTFYSNELLQVDTTTGAGSAVATLSAPVSPYGIAFRGSHLYTFDAGSDRIWEINKSTGALSGAIDIGVGNLTGEGDLAFRSDGTGFLSSALKPDFTVSNDLFRFDVTTGTSTRIGTTAVVLDGMAFVGSTLYGIGQEADAKLYIVNQTTAALTEVGALGVTNNSLFAGLAARSDGSLYAAINDQLFAINRTTGAAHSLDPTVLDTGYSSVSGLAFSPVPEPSVYGAAGVGTLMLVAWFRRKRSQAKIASAV